MGTLFKISELGDILKEAVPRSYKTTRLVDGRSRPSYILPTTPSIQLIVNEDHIRTVGIVHRFADTWFRGNRGNAAWGELNKRLGELIGEHYSDHNIVFQRETNKFDVHDTLMIYTLKFDKKEKMVSTSDLKQMVDIYKDIYEFGRRQTF